VSPSEATPQYYHDLQEFLINKTESVGSCGA